LLCWLAGTACSELDGGLCKPCLSKCPGDLSCDAQLEVCVPRDDPGACLETPPDGGGGLDGTGGASVTDSTASSTTDSGSTVGGSSGTGGSGAGGSGAGGSGGEGGDSAGETTLTSSSGTTQGSGPTQTTAGGTSGAGGTAPCTPSGCTPEIVTERQLGSICHDTEVRVEFHARCSCDDEGASRTVVWSGASVPGLTLDEDTGKLTGLPEPGRYEFDVAVGIDGSIGTHSTFELTVWDRCFAFLLSDDDEARPEVLAVRLDGEEGEAVPRNLGDTASVSAFDLSSDGKYLAQVEVLDDVEKLSLFRVGSDDVEAVAIDHTGNHRQHAFSRDNHWLAILTTNPDDSALSLLQLVDLSATPAVLLDAIPIAHVAGLAWSDVGGILYLSPYDDISDTVREQLVDDDGFGDETIYWDTLADLDPLVAFLVSDSGFFTLREVLAAYRDRDEDWVRPLARYPNWLSPDLGWMTVDEDAGIRLDPMYQEALVELPYATIPNCHSVSAWSADDSTFVGIRTAVPVVYQTGIEGPLYGTEIALADGLRGPTPRMALSEHGNWFAFVPSPDGLVVLPAADYASAEIEGAMLAAPTSGTNEWDFFFTRDERKLIVQRGRDLVIAALDPALPPVFTPVDVGSNLRAVPECLNVTYPNPARWCGTPRFAGNLGISQQETHLSLIDDDNEARIVDLTTLHSTLLGPISHSCASECIQFQ